MPDRTDIAPARRVLENAIATNDARGHENPGSLSYSHGFLPRQEALHSLPAGYEAWDEIAAAIPYLFRTYAVRQAVEAMPILSADEADLPDYYLMRASSLFSILAHLYWYCEPEAPENGIPPQIQSPWEQITRRLDRPAPHLSFIDLNSHNWHFIDPTLEQPFIVENLKLAIPMVGNEDERRFQTTPIEMLYGFAPLMNVILRAQEAVLHDDPTALEAALVAISDALKGQTYTSLMKVNPNPYSDLYINPVVWGKTAALFASPFQPNNSVPASGTAIPSFTTLDIFFGRKRYKTTVGHETDRTRAWFPKHWQEWLNALETVSVPEYVMRCANPTLTGIYEEARDSYAGESGMLARHRLKAYGFLDLSFKAGRVKTLGGFGGSYSARVWDRMAVELDDARLERYGENPPTTHMVAFKRMDTIREHEHQYVRRIVFDTRETGIRYQPGDRCGILPENSDELVVQTLAALKATGDEIIQLNAEWRWHVNLRDGCQNAAELPLRTLLKFGRIRPLDRTTALNLFRLTNNEHLRAIIDAWAEDQWELWDILNLLAERGYNPKRLWKATPGDYEHICRIIPPERWRLYSISSIMEQNPDEIHLTIGGLRYRTAQSNVSRETHRWGTSSNFLARLCAGESASNGRVSIKVIHPTRFSLPQDSSRPVVMFAGGTGIAPIRGLIDERMRDPNSGPTWLFFGTRQRDDFYYQDEFEPYVAEGRLNVRVAFSRDDASAQFNTHTGHFDFVAGEESRHIDAEMLTDENARLLWDMLRSTKEGGQGAYFYVCGRTAFASSVMDAARAVIARFADGGAARITEGERNEVGRQTLYRLIGEDRFMLEIFTTYAGAHFDERKQQVPISEVIMHNNDDLGYWIIVSGRVYDMNEFNHMHPGGPKIIQSYAGMDATIAYQKIEHHLNSEVDAMLGMYELGVLCAPDFGSEWGTALSPKGLRLITLRDAYYAWVDLVYMLVEVENAIRNDFRVRYEPFTDIETHGHTLLTPTKVQQLGLTHERLVSSYLPHVLGEPIETLWTLSVGLLGYSELDAGWMVRELQRIHESEAARAVDNMAAALRERIKQDEQRLSSANGYIEHEYGALCTLLELEDTRLLRELKLALRDGLMVFEHLERDTIRGGGGYIVAALKRVPTILEDFYTRLYERL